jgi:hypothetical protein
VTVTVGREVRGRQALQGVATSEGGRTSGAQRRAGAHLASPSSGDCLLPNGNKMSRERERERNESVLLWQTCNFHSPLMQQKHGLLYYEKTALRWKNYFGLDPIV